MVYHRCPDRLPWLYDQTKRRRSILRSCGSAGISLTPYELHNLLLLFSVIQTLTMIGQFVGEKQIGPAYARNVPISEYFSEYLVEKKKNEEILEIGFE